MCPTLKTEVSGESVKSPLTGAFFLAKKGGGVELKKLEELFYSENTHLIEVLDKSKMGQWDKNKTRGYGITLCSFKELRFGIPLRSHIKHHHAFITSDEKGLDFTKAVLLVKDSYISRDAFEIPRDEFNLLIAKEYVIKERFGKYVERYITAHTKKDANMMRQFRFSTLINYHPELGIV